MCTCMHTPTNLGTYLLSKRLVIHYAWLLSTGNVLASKKRLQNLKNQLESTYYTAYLSSVLRM